mgnify:CR=1 FL=1
MDGPFVKSNKYAGFMKRKKWSQDLTTIPEDSQKF